MIKMYSSEEARSIAIGATRARMRGLKLTPENESANDALVVLDEIATTNPRMVAAAWYLSASSRQITLFKREWKKWAEDYKKNLVV
jgi:hypothetical protein